MPQSLSPLDSLFVSIVLATLAIGLPIVFVLSIRFLWDRKVNLARSRELEKLIWQLHRIASALEHQMNLSFPAVQPGTEEPSDLAYVQQQQPVAPAKTAAQSSATPSAAAPAAQERAEQQPVAPKQPAEQAPIPSLVSGESSAEAQRHGVNSMFGL